MLNFIPPQIKLLVIPVIILISSQSSYGQDDYAIANTFSIKPIPDSIKAPSFASDTISVGKVKKDMGSRDDKINYKNGRENLNVNNELNSFGPAFNKEVFSSSRKRHKTTELNLDLTVVIYAGSKVVCYDTEVSITVGPHRLGLAFDGYELHLKKSEPLGTFELFNPYPNEQIKMINDNRQEYFLHSGLTGSGGWVLILTKGINREEVIFLSNNNRACIKN